VKTAPALCGSIFKKLTGRGAAIAARAPALFPAERERLWKENCHMKKRLTIFLSALLVVCSVLPLCAAAADGEKTISGNKGSLTIAGACSLPAVTIDVVVPTSTNTYINPSKVSVKLNGTISDAQIVTETGCIENRSVVPISVSATVTATLKKKSTMTLSSTSVPSSSKAKQAFVFFQMKAVDSSYSDPKSVSWDTTYDPNKHILVTESTRSKTDFITLDKYDPDAGGDTAKRCGAFMLTGNCSVNPTDAWTSKDGFTATIVFTFKALPYDTTVSG
jgi:invasion protein IalB